MASAHAARWLLLIQFDPHRTYVLPPPHFLLTGYSKIRINPKPGTKSESFLSLISGYFGFRGLFAPGARQCPRRTRPAGCPPPSISGFASPPHFPRFFPGVFGFMGFSGLRVGLFRA